MKIDIIYILVGIFGLTVGSFLNVVILRFDELKTLWKIRSHCVKCKKQIRWYDLVPFLSYIYLGGKCRYCKKPISYQYPIVEGLTAILFILIYFYFGLTWASLLLAVISSLFLIVATYDAIHYEIPDVLTYLGIFFSLGFVFLTIFNQGVFTWNALIPYGLGVLAAGGFLGALVVLSKEKWMGQGDILLGVWMGVLLGMPNVLVAMFLAFVLGSLYGLLLIGLKKKGIKDALPFGPFLILGTIIALFWGEKIIFYYLGIF